jgi:hypothetical protein
VSCNHIPQKLPQQTTSALEIYNGKVTERQLYKRYFPESLPCVGLWPFELDCSHGSRWR